MRQRKRAVFVIAFVGISAAAGLGIAQAADPRIAADHEGTKRALSYFLSDGNSCILTLMLAEEATATR